MLNIMLKKQIRFMLFASTTLLLPAFAADTAVSTQASAGTAQAKPEAKAPDLTTMGVPPLIILAPTEVRTDPTLARGCWARLFPKKDFKGGDDLTIAGPLELSALHTPLGVNWKHKTQSVIVGPKATVIIYENQKLRGKNLTLQPGSQVTDLRKEMGAMQTIDSLRITCDK